MAEETIPSPLELDWSDLTFYQHPPCMHTLWYIFTVVNLVWDPVKEFIDQILEQLGVGEGGGGDGGGGGEGEGGEEEGGGEDEGEANEEEPPAEEEEA